MYFKYVQSKKRMKYSTRISLSLSYLSYNLGRLCKNCPLTCSVSQNYKQVAVNTAKEKV